MRKDTQALVDLTQDASVMKYYGMPSFSSKNEAIAEINWFTNLFLRGEGIRWVITFQGQREYIGDIGYFKYEPIHLRAEIGFKIAQKYWRQGLMSETLGPILQYGFTEMQLNRIEAMVELENVACIGLLEKVGFIKEGVLREYEHGAHGYVDLIMMALLRKDWSVITK
jgi:ribosomal-protein-alanine N-acetyltransferase